MRDPLLLKQKTGHKRLLYTGIYSKFASTLCHLHLSSVKCVQQGSITVQLTSSLACLEMCLCAVQNSVQPAQSTFLNRSNRRLTVQWYFPFKCSVANHAILRLLSKLWLGRFVAEQKSKQSNDALTYSWLTVSKVHGLQCLYCRYVIYHRICFSTT